MTASYVSSIDGTGWLTHQDLLVVLAALRDAVEYRSNRLGLEDLRLIVRYRALSRGLGDDR